MRSSLLRSLLALAAASASVLVAAAPASAAGLTDVAWSLSKPHPGDTDVRYTWNFTTATADVIESVTFTVPPGTAGGSLSVVDAYGVGSGTADLQGQTVTYTLDAPISVADGVSVLVSIDGFTNAVAGTYASTVTTRDGGEQTIDTAGSNNVTIGVNTTQVTVQVAQASAFTIDTTAFELLLDPADAALSDRSKAVGLTVATNAADGYTLTTRIDRQLTGTVHATEVVPAASAGRGVGVIGGALPANRFGYEVSVTGDGVGAVQGAGLVGGGTVGYTTGGEVVVDAAGPTNGDVITVTNRAWIDFHQPADAYTATVTYMVTPRY